MPRDCINRGRQTIIQSTDLRHIHTGIYGAHGSFRCNSQPRQDGQLPLGSGPTVATHGGYQKRFRSLLFEPSNNPRDNKKQIAYATGTDSYSDSVAGLDTPGGPKRQKLFTHGTWNVAYGNYLW